MGALQEAGGFAGLLTSLSALGRAALFVEIRIDTPVEVGLFGHWVGKDAEVKATEFLRGLPQRSRTWNWQARIQFILEDDTLGTAWLPIHANNGTPAVRDAASNYYARLAEELRSLAAHCHEARRIVELLTGKPYPVRQTFGDLYRQTIDRLDKKPRANRFHALPRLQL